jgi:hypothetical protein
MHFFISLLIIFGFAFVICAGLLKMVWDLSQIGVHESPAILESTGNPASVEERPAKATGSCESNRAEPSDAR